MITVHHLNHSRSQRILWLLEELGLDYDIKRYERDPKTMLAPASLRAVHPLGKSPVITDGELTIAESGAIVDYLIERYGAGRLAPAAGTADRLRYTYWLHYAEGSAMSPLLLKLVFDKIETAPMPFFVKPIAKAISGKAKSSFIEPQIRRHLDYLEAELGKSDWFAGVEFSGADIQLDFLKRIHARPAYQRAIERGGEYSILT
jgi:glutathione S-transferase